MLRNVSGGAYPEGRDPVILPSARKRAIPDAEIVHAYHPILRAVAKDDMLLITGLTQAAVAIEVGYVIAEGTVFIIHSMPARKQYLPRPPRRRRTNRR